MLSRITADRIIYEYSVNARQQHSQHAGAPKGVPASVLRTDARFSQSKNTGQVT